MRKYSGSSIEEILDVVSLDEGIDQSLIHYHVLEESENNIVLNVFHGSDIIEFIKNYVETFFYNLNERVYVDVTYLAEVYRVFIDANNNAIIIGREGSTLQAFLNLLRSVTNSHFKKRIGIVMDVNNYKANRYEKVESMVYHIAREVVETKIDATLDFLPSDERRVVHHYLSGMENITTISVGEGSERRLVISYKEDEDN